MAMFTINSVNYQFITMVGEVPTPSQLVREISRSNVSGIALMRSAVRGRRFVIVAERDVLKAQLQFWQVTYQNLVGSIATWTDDHGDVWPNIAILEAPRAEIRRITSGVGGFHGSSGYALLKQQFVCVDTSATS